MGEQHIEVALGDVGARVADLLREPGVGESVQHLARRADVQADALGGPGRAEASDEAQHLGFALGLHGQTHARPQTGASESSLQVACHLGDALQVEDVERRAMLAGKRLGVSPGDQQTSAAHLESGPHPEGAIRYCAGTPRRRARGAHRSRTPGASLRSARRSRSSRASGSTRPARSRTPRARSPCRRRGLPRTPDRGCAMARRRRLR